jgi:hypothetical protein
MEFLPQNFEGWLRLLLMLFGALATIWTAFLLVVRKPLQGELNGYGLRLTKVEEQGNKADGRMEALERTDATHTFQVTSISERLGKIEGEHIEIKESLGHLLGMVEGRLGNIEGQLTIMNQRRDS